MACCSSAARGMPKPFHRLTRTSTALPPAFLAPRIHAQSFFTQPPQPASAPSSKNTSANSAQNLRGTLRRLGQSSKWSSQAPTKSADSGDGVKRDSSNRNGRSQDNTRGTPRHFSPRSSPSGARSALSAEERRHHFGFRLKAKELLEYIKNATHDLDTRTIPSRVSPVQIDAEINKVLHHFEREMRVLRVMIKTKDVLVDPDNAWKSASRIKAPCNAAIRLCLHHGRVERALKLFNSMKKDGIFPSAATYTVIINRLSRLIEQQIGPPSARSPEVLLQSKEVQRIRDLYHDIEKFWKQAFPMYFQRGAAGARPQSNDIMALDRDGFDKLTEQACRNLISQQASVKEIREHPKVFTHTIGAYLHFLRLVGTRDELTQLFDRLFPSTLIDTMAKGLAPNASPQDKLELANRNLSEWLPLGDVSTFSAFFFEKWESPHSERVATVERIWSRLSKLMDLELHERRTTTQGASRQYKQPKPPASKDENPIAAGQHAESDQPRFVPDDQLMIDIFNHLQPPTNAGPAPDLRLGLDIVSKVYGLDLESTADGIVRAHQSEQSDVSSGLRRYFTADANAIDGRAQPVAILRDSTVAMSLSRMLFGRELRNQRIALFNYLWAQGFADQQAAKSHDDAVGSAISDATTFGKTLRPTFVLNVLWDLCEAGDPVGARIILEAMKRTAQAASSGSPSTQDATNRRARRTRQATGHSDQNDAQDWKPSILSYLRVMRANLTALLKGPGGLTATIVGENGSHTTDSAVKEHGYDAWTEAKSLFAEWCDQKKFDSGSRQTSSRWASSEVHADHQDSRTGRKNGAARGDLPDALNRIHMDNMRSLFLHTAKICAVQQADKGAEVAREALNLVNDKIGLEVLVKEAEKLRDDVAIASKKAKARIHKVRTLDYLSKIIDLALDTSDHSFAPKADVELWKGVRKMLPASSVPADKADFKGGRDARKQLGGSNRLLLSKDDYRELEAEAEAEAEDEEDSEQGEDEQSPRGLYRMQRRSRHVEQELERWVRGAST